MKRFILNVGMIHAFILIFACAAGSGGGYGGKLTEGSKPVNKKEEVLYKQALIRCHKTGGTRVVKIAGQLRCF